jgi:hypothetical protein
MQVFVDDLFPYVVAGGFAGGLRFAERSPLRPRSPTAQSIGRLPSRICDETALHIAMELGLPGDPAAGHDQAP